MGLFFKKVSLRSILSTYLIICVLSSFSYTIASIPKKNTSSLVGTYLIYQNKSDKNYLTKKGLEESQNSDEEEQKSEESEEELEDNEDENLQTEQSLPNPHLYQNCKKIALLYRASIIELAHRVNTPPPNS